LHPEDVELRLVEITDEGDKPLPALDVTANVQRYEDYLRFKLVANNTSGQELHFALLDLANDFSVGIPYNSPVDPTSDSFEFVFPADGGDSSTIFTQVEEGAHETLFVMKLLLSTERVDSYLLEREPIAGLGEIKEFRVTRGAKGARLGFGSRPQQKITHKNEWFTKTVSIRLVLQSDRVNANEDIRLANDFITIKANPAVTADVALSSARSGMRSAGEPAGFYRALEQAGLSLVNFSKTRGEDQSILELSEIDDRNLHEHPLEILLNSELQANEYVLPVTFDGESLIVTGQPTKDDRGRTLVRIDHIPEIPNQRRSLLKALKLYFFKCVTGDNVNQLRWVEYDQGNVLRHASGVAEKVRDAKRVLVLVHGIIGDTKGIAEGLALVNVGGTSLDKKFDVVLTYDYENLNTPIKQTADTLKKQLADAGLQEGDGQHVTFLVHSMGGLVSRWFIEKEGGNKVVDHLVMCGTPNDGSPFGKVGQVRSVVSTLGTLALNVLPATAPYLGPLLYALNGSKKVTPTLEEMSHDSRFMKDLGSMGDPGVRYSIVAGDVRQYNASQDRLTGRLVAKLGKGWKFSKLFGEKGHDIAVQVDSIRHIQDDREPKPHKQSVTCHHMNYFVADEGLAALSKIEW
jgi:pimeloyl-ACP methyl ester carboxylesterase